MLYHVLNHFIFMSSYIVSISMEQQHPCAQSGQLWARSAQDVLAKRLPHAWREARCESRKARSNRVSWGNFMCFIDYVFRISTYVVSTKARTEHYI